MNRSTLAALVVALMLGSGIAGYLIGRPAQTVDQAPPSRTATTTPTPAPMAPTATPVQAPTPVTRPAAAPAEPFNYRRFTIDSSRPEAEACFAFNKPLVGDAKYADYLD